MLVFEHHVINGSQADAGAEDVLDAAPLAEERIHDGRPVGHEWRLAEVAQQRQDGVESLERLVADPERDPLADLSQDDQVEDDRAGQERVLARVVQYDRVSASQHYLACVLVHGSLRVADVRDVFDDDTMVGTFSVTVEDMVRINHIVNNVTLRNLEMGRQNMGLMACISWKKSSSFRFPPPRQIINRPFWNVKPRR